MKKSESDKRRQAEIDKELQHQEWLNKLDEKAQEEHPRLPIEEQ